MDRFYVITNNLKDMDYRITNEIKSYIEENGKLCILSKKDEDGHIIPESVPEGMDCSIVIGGDGTLIRAARELVGYDLPMLGVNMGTLGYLTEVEVQDYQKALDTLFVDRQNVEKRMMMRGSIGRIIDNIALNDIVVTRDGSLRIGSRRWILRRDLSPFSAADAARG